MNYNEYLKELQEMEIIKQVPEGERGGLIPLATALHQEA
jgi:hypothetical protein